MALSQKLELRQSQSLVMTPQLMQAIKLLQLSHLDLSAYVDAELERNPLLERADEPDFSSPTDAASGEPEPPPSHDEQRTGDWLEEPLGSREAIEARLDTDLGNVFQDDGPAEPAHAATEPVGYSEWASVGSGGRLEEDSNLDAYVSATSSLADHLAEQLALAETEPKRRLIGQYLIDLVDDAGYLTADLAEVADKLGAPLETVESVLAVIQTFDPSGVAARSLAECLALQLKERDRFDPAMAALVANLPLLARRDFAALKKLCGIDDEDLADMVAEIKRLDPKPGLALGGGPVTPIVPDVFVRPASDGGWQVDLNTDTLPRVLINQSYFGRVAPAAKDTKDKTFLADCLQTATWLTRALDQRAKTILKVAMEITRQQDAFLAHGVEHLRPLVLKTVADAISMHESTVSRVTSNKYMATPRGIFEMKYFFTSAIANANGGDAHSAEAVRHRIKQMIDAESAADVLSDDTIVKRLREAGIDIARRTVAKYREGMRIPSSVQRRREKQAAAASS
ncbi:RNA polymerase factor sigma-54 [Blastochloris viridis]|uniref:RNA polymerase sigma-54 factor n=1 Tax=Blastochloris viridis TaxID=1079 RepID=A0A0H5B8A3_BLAVI|nr:RNA polymerase factor sigma-54 [Blastochloris viridis]ALK08314.1 RNA polymerase sigma-54 factor 2 [Blastochloris viridis]BAR98417.1 RNA polymerase sigma-54 factor RpoN [Blastochloris viridis]CUU44236.1 RNA polymerase factor sigma-54 [Blastochloris viridis]